MAKRKTTRTYTPKPKVSKQGGVVVVSQPAPVQRRARAAVRRVGKAISGASQQSRMQGSFVGGLALGWIEKTFGASIPQVPVVGRKGFIAGAVYFLKPKNKILQDVGNVAAGIAGYQLGKEGRVDGEDDDDDMVHG